MLKSKNDFFYLVVAKNCHFREQQHEKVLKGKKIVQVFELRRLKT